MDYVLPQISTSETKSLFARESDTIATVINLEDKLREKGPRSSHGSDFGGLAYADSDSEYDGGNDTLKKGDQGTNRIQFPTSSPRSSKSSESAYSTRILTRSLSAASSSHSGHGARSTVRSVGALDRAMDPLFEDTPLLRACPRSLPPNRFFPQEWTAITRLGIVRVNHPSYPRVRIQVLP